jgi:hypothetical protein
VRQFHYHRAGWFLTLDLHRFHSILSMASSLRLPFYRSPFGSPAGRFEQRLASLRCSLSCRCTRCASSLPPEARGSLSFSERYLFFIGWRLWVNEKQTTFNKEKTPWQHDAPTQFQPH